jgi:hypothetical protein
MQLRLGCGVKPVTLSILKTTGHFTRRNKLNILPAVFSNLFCAYHWTNRDYFLMTAFITETENVYRAVRAECLNVVQAILGL